MNTSITNLAHGISRRDFVKTTAIGLTALSTSRVLGANERINCGFIGMGRMGMANMAYAIDLPQVRVAAVCDVYTPYLERAQAKAREAGHEAKAVKDFREILADSSIDAVCISTPDHWHAYMTVEACKGVKDVYVEKPACVFVEEGLKMVEAARKYSRVVQAGTMQRSGAFFKKAVEIVRSGELGEIHFCRLPWVGLSEKEGLGHPPDSDPLPGLDWNLWLGPAPERPFNRNRWRLSDKDWASFRYFRDYAGGRLTDWGVHVLDILHYAFEDKLMPKAVVALGGKLYFDDNTDTADTMVSTFEYPGFLACCELQCANPHPPFDQTTSTMFSTMFHGTRGTLIVNRAGLHVIPAPKSGLEAMELSDPGLRKMNLPHWENFIDCIRTRQRPVSDIATCVRSTIPLLLANLSMRFKTRLDWDESRATVLQEEVEQYLKAQYRPPWKLEV